jgi:hypothetical protein
VEWNLVGETSGSGPLDRELIAAFDDLWQQATPLSADVVERYAARAAPAAELRRAWDRSAKQAEDAAAALGSRTTSTSSGSRGATAVLMWASLKPPWKVRPAWQKGTQLFSPRQRLCYAAS